MLIVILVTLFCCSKLLTSFYTSDVLRSLDFYGFAIKKKRISWSAETLQKLAHCQEHKIFPFTVLCLNLNRWLFALHMSLYYVLIIKYELLWKSYISYFWNKSQFDKSWRLCLLFLSIKSLCFDLNNRDIAFVFRNKKHLCNIMCGI